VKRLKEVLSRVLEVDPGTITGETSPETVETWDSFNAMILVAELEQAFKVKFTMPEISAVKNVNDIKAALSRHGVTFAD
jgi:acyl carrier protein